MKNTTKANILDIVCPHFCRGCGQVGAILCECCKKNIFTTFTTRNDNVFYDDGALFKQIWCCGWRDDLIGQIVEEFKFQSVRKMKNILAECLDSVIPKLPDNTIIVPLPTSRSHIRERGLDHTYEIAGKLAKMRDMRVRRVLCRVHNQTQVGSDAIRRKKQAMTAYRLNQKISPNETYLLLDDIWTTGASMCSAAKILKNAGVKNIYGAVLVRSRNILFGGCDSTGVDANGIKNKVDNRESKDRNN